MKVNEIFESIQGEGRHAGLPVLFIRLSGCNMNCVFCDTKHHKTGEDMTTQQIVDRILQQEKTHIVWTGGEPILQIDGIKDVINSLKQQSKTYYYHHLETNGELLQNNNVRDWFYYICVSPKTTQTAEIVSKLDIDDVKVVTDTSLHSDMIQYATMLMPITTQDKKRNEIIQQNVWWFSVENNIRFCLRQHYVVWGHKRGV